MLGLLEAVLYHEEACNALGDSVIDLADYCMRAMTFLTASVESLQQLDKQAASAAALDTMTGQQQLEEQTRFLRLDMAIKALSILRYLTDNLSKGLVSQGER